VSSVSVVTCLPFRSCNLKRFIGNCVVRVIRRRHIADEEISHLKLSSPFRRTKISRLSPLALGNSKGNIFRRASSQEAVRASPNIGTKTAAPYDSSGPSESLWAVFFRGGKYPSGLAEIRWLCKEPRLPAEGVKEPGCMRAAEQGTAACTRILTCYM